MTLYESEIDSFKVLLMGMFFGWHLCRIFHGPKNLPWTIIRNVKFPKLNLRYPIKKMFRK